MVGKLKVFAVAVVTMLSLSAQATAQEIGFDLFDGTARTTLNCQFCAGTGTLDDILSVSGRTGGELVRRTSPSLADSVLLGETANGAATTSLAGDLVGDLALDDAAVVTTERVVAKTGIRLIGGRLLLGAAGAATGLAELGAAYLVLSDVYELYKRYAEPTLPETTATPAVRPSRLAAGAIRYQPNVPVRVVTSIPPPQPPNGPLTGLLSPSGDGSGGAANLSDVIIDTVVVGAAAMAREGTGDTPKTADKTLDKFEAA